VVNVDAIIKLKNLNVWYGENHVLKNINLEFYEKKITAIVGPSGCGKSTLLKTMNRLIELTENAKVSGEVLYRDINIYDPDVNVIEVRRRIGIVFQKTTPLPMSIYDNVAYGPRLHGISDKRTLDEIVKNSLIKVGLWDEVRHRLKDSAFNLSLGQQQRLAIARTISINPEVILMDEPTSALDPVSSMKIENLMKEFKNDYTIILVTHNLNQAKRVSDFTAFIYYGEIIEYNITDKIFREPEKKLTMQYMHGIVF